MKTRSINDLFGIVCCLIFSRNCSVHFRFHQILIVGKPKSASVSPAAVTQLPTQPATSWQFRHHLTNQKWGLKCLGKLMDTLLLDFQMTRTWWDILRPFTFTFMHLADTFTQSDLLQAIHCSFISICVSWESNPQPFVLLMQCSTAESQEHYIYMNTKWVMCRALRVMVFHRLTVMCQYTKHPSGCCTQYIFFWNMRSTSAELSWVLSDLCQQ